MCFNTFNWYWSKHLKIFGSLLCSYAYKLIYVDDQYSRQYKTWFGEDAIDKFVNDMIEQSEYCSNVIETEFDKPLIMSEKVHEDFNYSTDCWICKKTH